MDENRETSSPAERTDDKSLTRRSVLALCSGVSATLAGCQSNKESTPTGSPTPTRDGTTEKTPKKTVTETPSQNPAPEWASEFDRVVDAVEDLGCDPSGESACDWVIERGVGDDVGIRFPSGTYRFERGHRFQDFDQLGFIGVGDVSFVPPDGFNDKLFEFFGGRVRFEGIDVDVSAEETTAGLRFITGSGFHVEDVEFLGRGLHPDESVVNMLALAITDESARGTVRNIVAHRGSAIGHYKRGNGRVGIWIGGSHRGHVTVRDCQLEEFGNNGIYGSRCDGTVDVLGGLYRNNNVCGVRLGGGGNSIRGAHVKVDLGQYTGPYTRTDTYYNTRAIVAEQGPYDLSGRILIEDCDIEVLNAESSQGGIVTWTDGNGPRIVGCRIRSNVDWTPVIRGSAPAQKVNESERAVEIVDTTITDDGSGGSSIELERRPGSTIKGTTIEQSGAQRNGLTLVDSSPCILISSSITSTQYPIYVVDPDDSTDTCFVEFAEDTKINRTYLDSSGLQKSKLDADSTVRTSVDGADRCLNTSVFSGVDNPDGIGIAEINGDTVSWRHYPPSRTQPSTPSST